LICPKEYLDGVGDKLGADSVASPAVSLQETGVA